MSGRDLRSFLEGHRAGTFSLSHGREKGLHDQYIAGFGGRGIKAVDYSRLISQAQDHRATARLQVSKLKALSKQGQASREAWFTQLHQGVWQHEWNRLVTEGQRLEGEVEQWRVDSLMTAGEGGDLGWMVDIMEYTAQLQQDTAKFQEDVILCVLHKLQVDLKNWVNCPEAERGDLPQCTDLQVRCDLVKQQQREVERVLQDEYARLWCDLKGFHGAGVKVDRSAPSVLQAAECPNPALKASLTAEFHTLNQHYQLLLDNINKNHLGGELDEATERVGYIIEQYPLSLERRRAAYMDRLAREFPHYSRKQMVALESKWLSWRHGLQQRDACLRDWSTQSKGLEVRVQAALEEYSREVAAKAAGQVAMEAQTALCRELQEKVAQWRAEKEALAAAQAERKGALLLEQQAAREREERKRRLQRERTKVKLEAYHEEEEERRVEEEAWLARLREETEEMRMERALRGHSRVNFRREQQAKKLSQQMKVLAEREEEEREREKRLEAIRQQVKVNVTSDPQRVLQQTAAVQARLTSDPDPPLQRPLFPIHGFSAERVASDPRVRLEEALRRVGLHESEYARRVMASMPPPTLPRPDQRSSLFQGP